MDSIEITDYTAQFGEEGERARQERRRKELRATTKISGWLSLLVLAVLLGGIQSLCMQFAQLDLDGLLANTLLNMSDVMTGVLLFILGIVAPVKAWRRSDDAVFYLRLYMALCLTVNLAGLAVDIAFGDHAAADAARSAGRASGMAARSILWPAIWLIYTYRSRKVAEVFPLDYRRTPASAVVVALLAFGLPVLTFGVGYWQAKSRAANWSRVEFGGAGLAPREFTDGHIVFTAPEGVSVRGGSSDGAFRPLAVFKEGIFDGMIYCDVFSTKDVGRFNEVRNELRDTSLGPMSESDEQAAMEPLPELMFGRRAAIRIKSVRLDGDIFWRFAMIYAPEHAKTVVFSFYDDGSEKNYFLKLLESVRFSPAK